MLAEKLHYQIKYKDGARYGNISFSVGTTQEEIEKTFLEEIKQNNSYQLKFAGHTLYLIDRQCFTPLF